MNDVYELQKFAENIPNNPSLIKTAGLMNKLASFFISGISWLVKAALVAAGVWVGGSAIKHLTNQEEDKDQPTQDTKQPPIKISPQASQDLFTPHNNDSSSVWIEHGDIDTIENTIASWVVDAYPQFSKYVDTLKSSAGFQSIISTFKQRNRLAQGLGIISIPHPFSRKIDIVNTIVNSFLEEGGQSPKVQTPKYTLPSNNSIYK